MSFQIELDKYDEAYGHFMREVRNAVQETFAQEAERRGLTQADISRELNVDSSVVSRSLNGAGNVTLRTICDLYTAMGRDPLSNFVARDAWNRHHINEMHVMLLNSSVENMPTLRAGRFVNIVHTVSNSVFRSHADYIEGNRLDLYPLELAQTARVVHNEMRASVNIEVEPENA